MRQVHEFEPVFDRESNILILGTFPSVKSREIQFYYGNPQNRFWKVLANVYGNAVVNTIEQKIEFLLENKVAIWDVVASCDIVGSSDSSIRNVVANDINSILEQTNIQRIYANGATAKKLYDKYCKDTVGREIILLPSSSPANASFSLQKLQEIWNELLK